MMSYGLFKLIASQVVAGKGVQRTIVNNLARKVFVDRQGRKIVAIQQNPNTASSWAKMAKSGHKIVQFKDVETDKYIAVSIDGRIREYKPSNIT